MAWINKNVWILTCESDKKSLDEHEYSADAESA